MPGQSQGTKPGYEGRGLRRRHDVNDGDTQKGRDVSSESTAFSGGKTPKPVGSTGRLWWYTIGGVVGAIALLGLGSQYSSLFSAPQPGSTVTTTTSGEKRADIYTPNAGKATVMLANIPPTMPTNPVGRPGSTLPSEFRESTQRKYQETADAVKGMSSKQAREKMWRRESLSREEAGEILHLNEYTNNLPAGGDNAGRIRVDMNQVAANYPIEDYMTWSGVNKASDVVGSGAYMFGVFDGHAGYLCAQKLTETISGVLNETIKTVAQLTTGDGRSVATAERSSDNMLGGAIQTVFKETGESEIDAMTLALAATFVRLDQMIAEDSLKAYMDNPDELTIDRLLGPAVSGSCALVAVVDLENSRVTVANAGDSRAILGMKLPSGAWKAVPLSIDQNPDNPLEYERLVKQHPGEGDTVRRGHRLLGALAISRAFGDVCYKWPKELQDQLFPILSKRGHWYAKTPQNFYTPPYLTAYPDIVQHKLDLATDKFIVMASDGLQIHMEDDEVIQIMGKWWDEHRGTAEVGSGSISVSKRGDDDKNAATYLMRMALSKYPNTDVDPMLMRRVLAIPPPHARRFRDDLSISVIFLDQPRE